MAAASPSTRRSIWALARALAAGPRAGRIRDRIADAVWQRLELADPELVRAGATVTAAGLLDGLRGELAKVKVPVDLILLDEVPKNPVGKIDKPKLRQRDRA